MGLIGRQKRVLASNANDTSPDLLKHGPFTRTNSISSSRSTSFDFHVNISPSLSSQSTSDHSLVTPSYFNLNREGASKKLSRRASGRSDSGDTLYQIFSSFSLNDSESQKSTKQQRIPIEEEFSEHENSLHDLIPLHPVNNHQGSEQKINPQAAIMPPPMALFDPDDISRRFVGTPDYLAPETVNGVGQDETSDWWSVGCILFEFLHGFPPFHAETPDKVFENILARKISWPEEGDFDVSTEAKDLVNKLLCLDPKKRLGSNINDEYECGGDEIQAHLWFEDVAWDKLLEDQAQFVPAPENPEDTEYFDSRGATLQSFTEDMEDQASDPNSITVQKYHERPHDALSHVRNHANSTKRNMLPLHIPPHVRDIKSRRLSEPIITDDFGNFTFKNLPVLEKANKDVIQKLRAEAMATHNKSNNCPLLCSNITISTSGTVESNPIQSNPVQRNISSAKGSSARSSSPSGYSQSNTSPNRVSQPSSPLLVSFIAGSSSESRRKASSTSSSHTYNSTGSTTYGSYSEAPRITAGVPKPTSNLSSPIKAVSGISLLPHMHPSSQRAMNSKQSSNYSNRARSLTVDSQDSNSSLPIEAYSAHKNRRSQVFEMSPSSSDNEGDKETALLRVQRRRQSSRRLSQIYSCDGPSYRPLDVLICEDHPVTRMVTERLLEKLRCRSITVSNGAEAVRFAMGEIQFDIIIMEFKLPQINGADVARMIRDTKNANSHTPIVALTGYLKELQAPHQFDALIEKPPTTSKLTDVMCRLCQWKTITPSLASHGPLRHRNLSELRLNIARADDYQTHGSFLPALVNDRSFSPAVSVSSKERLEKNWCPANEQVPIIINHKATDKWEKSSIRNEETQYSLRDRQKNPPENVKFTFNSINHNELENTQLVDDKRNEQGEVSMREKSFGTITKTRRGSKLSTEMMRTNSQGSIISGSELSETKSFNYSQSYLDVLPPKVVPKSARLTPLEVPYVESQTASFDREETPTINSTNSDITEEEPTPRATLRPS